jgi:pyridinium-3,5-bisthiocarboxylic acid mononucleotide nickel chelatase
MGVPAPAVVKLAAGWKIFVGGGGELTTPTGMALDSTLAERCEDLLCLRFRLPALERAPEIRPVG